jgi:hypothetical protein
MPRAKQTGDRYADKGRSSAKSAGVASEAVRGAGVEVLLAAATQDNAADGALDGLAAYDEGWLRIISHDFGALRYYKFKFSKGKYAGSYVFVRSDGLRPRECLWLLLGKVQKVYEGTMRPTPDTPYD